MTAPGTATVASPRPYYHAADFLVHPTYYDPCSRVVLEALSARLPCLTTRFDGAGEVVAEAGSGVVVDTPDDVEAIVDGVGRRSDAGTRELMRANTLSVAQRITMRRHAEEILAIYAGALKNGGNA